MAELAGRRVLVSGAAGFIGARLVRALLDEGAEVVALVRPDGARARLAEVVDDVELVEADVRDGELVAGLVQQAQPELAANLAMPPGHPTTPDARVEHLAVAAVGAAILTEALASAGCHRLVHVGSSLEYGHEARTLDEDALLAPATPRGAAKAAGTLVCLAWARALELPAVVVRPFSVYGPGEPEHRLVPTAFRAALGGHELALTRRGLVHDFVYVDDVVRAITLALTAPADQRIVNIGSGVQTTNEELVALVECVTGREIRLSSDVYPEQDHDRPFWKADVALAREILGWTPSTGLEDGLRATHSALQLEASVTRP